MTLNRNQKQSIIKALEASLRCLGITSNLVCHSIDSAQMYGYITVYEKNLAKGCIRDLLGVYSTVTSWLYNNSPEYLETLKNTQLPEQRILNLDYRKKWVAHMIKELST